MPLDLTGESVRRVAARSAEAPGAPLNGTFASLFEIVQAGIERHPDGDTAGVPDLATSGSFSFVDLAYYVVGDRRSAVLEVSPHYKFGSDVTAISWSSVSRAAVA
jgi:hypothetical protein